MASTSVKVYEQVVEDSDKGCVEDHSVALSVCISGPSQHENSSETHQDVPEESREYVWIEMEHYEIIHALDCGSSQSKITKHLEENENRSASFETDHESSSKQSAIMLDSNEACVVLDLMGCELRESEKFPDTSVDTTFESDWVKIDMPH